MTGQIIAAVSVRRGVVFAAKLYLGIGEAAFRKVVLGLLTASGVAMLAAAVLVLIHR